MNIHNLYAYSYPDVAVENSFCVCRCLNVFIRWSWGCWDVYRHVCTLYCVGVYNSQPACPGLAALQSGSPGCWWWKKSRRMRRGPVLENALSASSATRCTRSPTPLKRASDKDTHREGERQQKEGVWQRESRMVVCKLTLQSGTNVGNKDRRSEGGWVQKEGEKKKKDKWDEVGN